jgi:hypothetical protein
MMDESTARTHIEAHADAVVSGDQEALAADFSDELRPSLPQLAQALPQPVTSSEVQDIQFGDEQTVSTITYSGPESSVTIRAEWREQGGRPVIVHAEPVG